MSSTPSWNAADPSRVVHIINTLAGQPWPLNPTQLREVLHGLGWTPRPGANRAMDVNLGVTPGLGSYSVSSKNEVGEVDFAVTDSSPDDDLDVKADFLQDTFAAYAEAFRDAWGEPFKIVTEDQFTRVWWTPAAGGAAQLSRSGRTIAVYFVSPKSFETKKAIGEL